MVMRRMVVMSWCCLMILASPAWADQALMVKGMEAQKAGRNEEALKLLNIYVDRFPQIAEARYYRALALAGLGRYKEALEDVDKALVDNPKNVNFLLAKGNILVSLERRPEAILIYTQAMQCDPRNAEACKERGDCLAQEGQFAEAIADLNRAAGLARRDPWVFNKRGMVWFCQGEYQKAVDDFTTAIRLQPDLAISYFFRANVYLHHLKEPEKAAADYQEGCRLGSSLCCGELEKMRSKPAAGGK
jgi:tetratricopeptide (TPR) repeat protein